MTSNIRHSLSLKPNKDSSSSLENGWSGRWNRWNGWNTSQIAVKQFTGPKFSTLEIALAFSPLRGFHPLSSQTQSGWKIKIDKRCKTKDETPGLQTLYPLARRSCDPVWPRWNRPKPLENKDFFLLKWDKKWKNMTSNSKAFQAAVSVRSEIARRASQLQRSLEYVCFESWKFLREYENIWKYIHMK